MLKGYAKRYHRGLITRNDLWIHLRYHFDRICSTRDAAIQQAECAYRSITGRYGFHT